jgi:hypothetical protein
LPGGIGDARERDGNLRVQQAEGRAEYQGAEEDEDEAEQEHEQHSGRRLRATHAWQDDAS